MCLENYVVAFFFFKMLFSIGKPDILRVTSGKLWRIFPLLVEGNGIWTEQKRFVLGGAAVTAAQRP